MRRRLVPKEDEMRLENESAAWGEPKVCNRTNLGINDVDMTFWRVPCLARWLRRHCTSV